MNHCVCSLINVHLHLNIFVEWCSNLHGNVFGNTLSCFWEIWAACCLHIGQFEHHFIIILEKNSAAPCLYLGKIWAAFYHNFGKIQQKQTNMISTHNTITIEFKCPNFITKLASTLQFKYQQQLRSGTLQLKCLNYIVQVHSHETITCVQKLPIKWQIETCPLHDLTFHWKPAASSLWQQLLVD